MQGKKGSDPHRWDKRFNKPRIIEKFSRLKMGSWWIEIDEGGIAIAKEGKRDGTKEENIETWFGKARRVDRLQIASHNSEGQQKDCRECSKILNDTETVFVGEISKKETNSLRMELQKICQYIKSCLKESCTIIKCQNHFQIKYLSTTSHFWPFLNFKLNCHSDHTSDVTLPLFSVKQSNLFWRKSSSFTMNFSNRYCSSQVMQVQEYILQPIRNFVTSCLRRDKR